LIKNFEYFTFGELTGGTTKYS